MARTTRKQLDNMAQQLAALTQTDAYVSSYNPGDHRRYAIGRERGSRFIGIQAHAYTAAELDQCLYFALDAIRLALGEDEYSRRIATIYAKKGA